MNTLRPALYYPYIHIRSEQWLKATLLCMPCVKRIVPEHYTPEDDPAIQPYTTIKGPFGELLQAVPAYTRAAIDAQERLLAKLIEHAAAINHKYDRSRAPAVDEYWIHNAKFTDNLLLHLTTNNLAWHSQHSRAYGHRTWYALHPILGKAIMTTLGLSIAADQRYDIVTADGDFHEALFGTKENDIFDTLLGNPVGEGGTTSPQTRQDLGQLVITLTGVNYQALHPQSIPELQASKHFQSFQQLLRASASTVDRDADPDNYHRQLQEEAERIITTWRDMRRDLSRDLLEVLFEGVGLGAEAIKTVIKGPGLFELALVGGLGIWRIKTKVHGLLQQRDTTHHYLSELVGVQDQMLQLRFPLGLEA